MLVKAPAELYADNPVAMSSPEPIPTANVISPGDVDLFWIGVEQGLIRLERGRRFNTFDRPLPRGHWALLWRSKSGG
jgi:hypothetical protein